MDPLLTTVKSTPFVADNLGTSSKYVVLTVRNSGTMFQSNVLIDFAEDLQSAKKLKLVYTLRP